MISLVGGDIKDHMTSENLKVFTWKESYVYHNYIFQVHSQTNLILKFSLGNVLE